MYKVGITGGIGTGKSTVCKIFEILKVPVLYADDVAKEVMLQNIGVRSQLVELFGKETYIDNQLNRQHIAGIVFKDAEKLRRLNAIVHPATLQAFEDWSNHQDAAYVLKEAALMFESGADKMNDFNITVTAPLALRIQRVMKRDQCTEEDVIARMNKQWPEEEKINRSNAVIVNDGKHGLIEQIMNLHQQILVHAGS